MIQNFRVIVHFQSLCVKVLSHMQYFLGVQERRKQLLTKILPKNSSLFVLLLLVESVPIFSQS